MLDSAVKIYKGKYKGYLKIPGGKEGFKQKYLPWGGMDIS